MIYGKEELLPRVVEAKALPDYNLLITFNNGEKKIYDVRPLLSLPVYRPVRDIFSTVHVDYGTVVWPGDIDISPEKLYLHGKPIYSND